MDTTEAALEAWRADLLGGTRKQKQKNAHARKHANTEASTQTREQARTDEGTHDNTQAHSSSQAYTHARERKRERVDKNATSRLVQNHLHVLANMLTPDISKIVKTASIGTDGVSLTPSSSCICIFTRLGPSTLIATDCLPTAGNSIRHHDNKMCEVLYPYN